MGRRITRAKAKIKATKIPYRVPFREDLPARVTGVLAVLYLIFNEGYLASDPEQEAVRSDLTAEAIRLTRLVRALMPADGEVAGLLALMLLTEARRPARVSASGELVAFDEQDRGSWDRELIAEGHALVRARLASGEAPGRYQYPRRDQRRPYRRPATSATPSPPGRGSPARPAGRRCPAPRARPAAGTAWRTAAAAVPRRVWAAPSRRVGHDDGIGARRGERGRGGVAARRDRRARLDPAQRRLVEADQERALARGEPIGETQFGVARLDRLRRCLEPERRERAPSGRQRAGHVCPSSAESVASAPAAKAPPAKCTVAGAPSPTSPPLSTLSVTRASLRRASHGLGTSNTWPAASVPSRQTGR